MCSCSVFAAAAALLNFIAGKVESKWRPDTWNVKNMENEDCLMKTAEKNDRKSFFFLLQSR